jgi:flagellar hook-associated protein 1 FlgK
MATLSTALGNLTSALDAEQSALNVTANNVSNASTTGYTREIPNFEENPSVTLNGVSYGAGVTMTGGVSQRDLVLNQRVQQQTQLQSAAASRLTALNDLQSYFTPASSTSSTASAGNIGADISTFFSSFTKLESNPSDNSLRENVLSTATTLSSDVSNTAESISSQRSSLNQQVLSVVSQVNSLSSSLAQLNQQIQSTSPNQDAGTLEDQRQQDLLQLSQLIGINTTTTEGNGMTVTTTGGAVLVTEGQSYALNATVSSGMYQITASGTDITSGLASGGGSLGGLLTARDTDLPTVSAQLDQMAFAISNAVNNQNNSGSDINGNSGNENLFVSPTQIAGSAANMSVVMTDPGRIAAASLGAGPGDDTNAVAMAAMAKSQIVNGTSTASDSYSNLVTGLGSLVTETQNQNTALTASVSQLTSLNSSASSVDLNEEAAQMTTFERAYQAASQAFNILNQAYASALNLGQSTAVS